MAKTFKSKNGKALLYTRITVNGKRLETSLKRKISIQYWAKLYPKMARKFVYFQRYNVNEVAILKFKEESRQFFSERFRWIQITTFIFLLNWLCFKRFGTSPAPIVLNRLFSLSINKYSTLRLRAMTSRSLIFCGFPTLGLLSVSIFKELSTSTILKIIFRYIWQRYWYCRTRLRRWITVY